MKSNGKLDQSRKTLGEWTLHPELSYLQHAKGEELYLEPRLMKLLSVLLQHESEILKREDLIHQVWEETMVNEESLTKAIFDLRKVIKMHFPTNVKIQTVRKVGYRLMFTETIPEKSRLRTLSRIMLKAALYLFLVLFFVILLVRAINY